LPIENRVFKTAGLFTVAIALALLTPGSAAAKTKSSHAKATHSSSRHHSSKYRKTASRGQHSIDSQRTLAIQNALIREHYLNGEPTGVWDQASKAAMVRF